MNILHICSYYIANKLYKKLFTEFANDNDFRQDIYIPIKKEELKNKNKLYNKNVNLYYDNVLMKKDRILYKTKIKKQFRRILTQVENIQSVDLVHAHTLFSDGGTAFLLKEQFNIKYVVSVRATDINVFYKYGIHLRGFAKSVLLNAEAIIFISKAYQEKTFELFDKNIVDAIKGKTYVIPNGIDNIWLDNVIQKKSKDKKERIELLFTGTIDKNKNLKRVIEALKELNQKERKYFLHIAGEGPLREELENYVLENKMENDLKFYGFVNKGDLVKLMDNADIFVLPSIHETFGISYIEAMSRGVPVIYSEGQGIFGLYEEGQVGYAVNPLSVQDIRSKILLIQDNYQSLSKECIVQSKKFSWNLIATQFKKLYYKSL